MKSTTLEKEYVQSSQIIQKDLIELAEHLKAYHSFFEGKTFFITGAFGFLGKYLCNLLKYLNEEVLEEKAKAYLVDNFVTGYNAGVFSDENLTFLNQDVSKPFTIDSSVDYLIHAAGIASPAYYTKYPIETMEVGTTATKNLLEQSRDLNLKSFIFMSSSEVYGDPDPKFVPTNETYRGNVSVQGARACYDESKRFGETICYTYKNLYNIPVKIVRPFNVYGPGIRPDDFRVLPNFIEHALRGDGIPVHGKGENTRSFCYITDAIEAIFLILFSNENGEAFNIGNPSPEISVAQLAKKVQAIASNSVDIHFIEPPHAVYASSDPKRRCPDISKIKNRLGFQPKVTLTDGLQRTMNWFQEQAAAQ